MRMHENSELSGTILQSRATPPPPSRRTPSCLASIPSATSTWQPTAHPSHARPGAAAAAGTGRGGGRGRTSLLRRGGAPPPDFAVSAPEVFLAAGATATKNIRLGSAVTVLSSDDPIRVFQRFATSTPSPTAGPKSCWAGVPSSSPSRCSAWTWPTTRSCLRKSWSSTTGARPEPGQLGRPHPGQPPRAQMVYPPWKAACCPPGSAWAAPPSPWPRCAYGYPIILAIIGGEPRAFRPAGGPVPARHGQVRPPMQALPPIRPATWPTPTRQAREEYFPHWLAVRNRLGAERGWGPGGRGEFEAMCDARGRPVRRLAGNRRREDRPAEAATSAWTAST